MLTPRGVIQVGQCANILGLNMYAEIYNLGLDFDIDGDWKILIKAGFD